MMSSGRYMAYSPSPSAPHSPHIGTASGSGGMRAPASALIEQEKYLSELLSERNKLSPFVAVLPYSYRLLSQVIGLISHVSLGPDLVVLIARLVMFEILRVTTLLERASVLEQNGLEQVSPLASGGMYSNGGANNRWPPPFQSEVPGLIQPSSAHNWLGSHGSSSGLIVTQMVRVDVPIEQYPNYNFVGRLLGPRGNSLKRVEAATGCRVLIRGRGSIKDPARVEEMMRGKQGYEHLNEPLHVILEAELPIEIIDDRLRQAREILEDLLKPMDESQDYYKQQQLRELALINGKLREEESHMSGSVSPFNSSLGMKRAKTGV
ncbi:hypothetical protein OROHE_010553 [Orobanche hederae]